jgi:uncharacterized membrane protein
MSHTRIYEDFSPLWYGVLVFFAALLFTVSMGGGLLGLDSGHFYHKMSLKAFESLCHQQHDRSLVINGVSMAVCSRCFGIYSAFFAGLIVMPMLLSNGLPYRKKPAIKLIVAALLLIVVDFVGNYLGAWMNSHQSRIILGALFGLSLAWLLAGEFKQKPNLQAHGTS